MIPTGLPVLLTLGVMGFAGVRLDVGTAMVAAVVIGIAIDDTVHLLTQYRRRRARGLEAAISIEQAVAHVARALITTSVALALGFLSLVVSPWRSVASFGVVASLAISVALLADLVVLPALILVLSRRRAGRCRVAARI
jgi:predicted RND superfamily exporter protein